MPSFTALLVDEAATLALGQALVRILQPGLVLHLHGELGAGKTCLTRALLHAAGYVGRVKSPTYTLMEPYTITLKGQSLEILHFDLYRLGNPREFVEAGFRDQLDGSAICIIEWPEQAANVLPPPDLDLFLTVTGNSREVELLAKSEQGKACLHQLQFNPHH